MGCGFVLGEGDWGMVEAGCMEMGWDGYWGLVYLTAYACYSAIPVVGQARSIRRQRVGYPSLDDLVHRTATFLLTKEYLLKPWRFTLRQ